MVGLLNAHLGLTARALETERLHLLVEVTALEIEQPRSLGRVVAAEGKRTENDLALRLFHLHVIQATFRIEQQQWHVIRRVLKREMEGIEMGGHVGQSSVP